MVNLELRYCSPMQTCVPSGMIPEGGGVKANTLHKLNLELEGAKGKMGTHSWFILLTL